MKKDRVEPTLQALVPILVTVLSLFAISMHEVLEGILFPSFFGWLASPLSVLVSLAVAALAAYFGVPLLLKETAANGATAFLLGRYKSDGVCHPGEGEDTYGMIIENMCVATMIIEEDGRISLVNPEFEKLSGFSRKEIEGAKSAVEFVPQEWREKLSMYHKARRKDAVSVPKTYKSQFVERAGQ